MSAEECREMMCMRRWWGLWKNKLNQSSSSSENPHLNMSHQIIFGVFQQPKLALGRSQHFICSSATFAFGRSIFSKSSQTDISSHATFLWKICQFSGVIVEQHFMLYCLSSANNHWFFLSRSFNIITMEIKVLKLCDRAFTFTFLG